MSQQTDQRLTELEIKASFTEDALDQLSQVVYRQQQQIDVMLRELAELRRRAPEEPAQRAARDERPPHY